MLKILSGLLLALSLFACGGGGSPDIPVQTPTILRPACVSGFLPAGCLNYGYYLTWDGQVAETADHVNLLWVGGTSRGDDGDVADMAAAKMPTMYDLSLHLFSGACGAKVLKPLREIELQLLFKRLSDEGLLQYILAFIPQDEPDVCVINQADVLEANRNIRQAAGKYVGFAPKLAVVFAGVTRLHNIEDFDIVSFDLYSARSSIFKSGAEYSVLRARMRPGQYTMIISGGYEGWQQDPMPFFNFAETNPEVIAMISFLWLDMTDGTKGIRSLPNRAAYCRIGKQITGKSGDCL